MIVGALSVCSVHAGLTYAQGPSAGSRVLPNPAGSGPAPGPPLWTLGNRISFHSFNSFRRPCLLKCIYLSRQPDLREMGGGDPLQVVAGTACPATLRAELWNGQYCGSCGVFLAF